MKSKFMQIARWSLKSSLSPLIVIYCIELALYVGFAIFFTSIRQSMVMSMRSTTGIWLFVMGIIIYQQVIRVGLSHGVSRRSIWLGTAMYALSLTAFTSLADAALALIFDRWLSSLSITTLDVGAVLRDQSPEITVLTAGMPGVIARYALLHGVDNLFSGLATLAAGFFVGAGYYRMNRLSKILVSVGVPVAFVLFATLLVNNSLPGAWMEALMALAGWALTGTNMLIVYGAASILLMGCVWLMTRRAPIKAATA